MNETTQQNHLFDNKKLAALLIPLAVDQLLNSFMGTVDTLVVSNLGSAAISAVSLVDSINILIVQAFFALASGGTVVCSHYLGCGKKEHAQGAARQLVFITFVLSAVIAGMCLLFNGPMLALIFGKVESAVMVNAKKYFFFSAISYPFIALYDDGSCILRAQENSRLPMLISVISNILNILLNLLFVWVFHWGVAGSATATMLARMFSMVTVLESTVGDPVEKVFYHPA
jgi:putative MATE family efflux protein